MSIAFTCPTCSKALSAPASFAGKSAACKNCGQMLMIPDLLHQPGQKAHATNLETFYDPAGSLAGRASSAPPQPASTKPAADDDWIDSWINSWIKWCVGDYGVPKEPVILQKESEIFCRWVVRGIATFFILGLAVFGITRLQQSMDPVYKIKALKETVRNIKPGETISNVLSKLGEPTAVTIERSMGYRIEVDYHWTTPAYFIIVTFHRLPERPEYCVSTTSYGGMLDHH